MITSSFTLYGIEDAQQDVLVLSPHAVTVSAYNVQRDPLLIRVNHLYGSHTESLYAYVLVRIMSVDLELGQHDFGLCTEASYTLPVDKWGSATRIVVEAYTDEAHRNLIVSESVSIIAENPTPFPITEPWGPGYRYKNGEYLLVGDVVYMWRNRVTGNTLTAPDKVAVSDPFYGSWQRHEQWALLVTQMFMAKSALIGSSVFDGDWTISQHGESKGVNPNTEKPYDYRDFEYVPGNPNDNEDTNEFPKFEPALAIDWLKGKMFGRDVDLQGGNIGGFNINNYNLRNKKDKDCWISIEYNDNGNYRKSSLGNNLPAVIGYSAAGYYEASGKGENMALVINATGSERKVTFTDEYSNYCLYATGGVKWKMNRHDFWSMPGVLFGGHFGGGGEPYEVWGNGAGKVICSHNGTGSYTIRHEIGTMCYFVSITPMKLWACATLQDKGANSFGFTITDVNKGLQNLEFDMIIFGIPAK